MSGKAQPGRAAVPRSRDLPSDAKRPTDNGAARQHRPTIVHEEAPPYRGAAAPEGNGRNGGGPLRFIDLFCGIGGFRLAFERAGARCVFSSDWDKYSRQTYAANFGETPHGDIHAVAGNDYDLRKILARCSERNSNSGNAASSGRLSVCPS